MVIDLGYLFSPSCSGGVVEGVNRYDFGISLPLFH